MLKDILREAIYGLQKSRKGTRLIRYYNFVI